MNYMRHNLEYLSYSMGYTVTYFIDQCQLSRNMVYVPGNPSFSDNYLNRIRRFVIEKAWAPWVLDLFDRCVEEPLKKTDVVQFEPLWISDVQHKRETLRRLRYFLSIDVPTMAEKTNFAHSTICQVESGVIKLADYHMEVFHKVFQEVAATDPALQNIYDRSKTERILNRIPKGAHCTPYPQKKHAL